MWSLCCHDFNKSVRGLIESNSWLLDEVNVALNKKDRNQSEYFATLLLQKVPLQEMQPHRALMPSYAMATKTAAGIFCCCCSAGRRRHSKMWQVKNKAMVAVIQRTSRSRETKIHGGCCSLLWVELLVPSRQEGFLERLTVPHSR